MRVATIVAFALFPFVSLFAPGVTASTPTILERSVYLMGTRARLVLLAPDRAAGLQRLEAMVASLEQTEAELSTWRTERGQSSADRQAAGAGGAGLCVMGRTDGVASGNQRRLRSRARRFERSVGFAGGGTPSIAR